MIIPSVWLGLALLLSLFAWLANRKMPMFVLPLAAVIAGLAIWVPTGTPRFTQPPKGDYAILGSKIVVDVAIYLLLDDGAGEPRYYRLPYSASKADELQDAINVDGGKGVRVVIEGTEGGESYEGPPPPSAQEHKVHEAPEFTLP